MPSSHSRWSNRCRKKAHDSGDGWRGGRSLKYVYQWTVPEAPEIYMYISSPIIFHHFVLNYLCSLCSLCLFSLIRWETFKREQFYFHQRAKYWHDQESEDLKAWQYILQSGSRFVRSCSDFYFLSGSRNPDKTFEWSYEQYVRSDGEEILVQRNQYRIGPGLHYSSGCQASEHSSAREFRGECLRLDSCVIMILIESKRSEYWRSVFCSY